MRFYLMWSFVNNTIPSSSLSKVNQMLLHCVFIKFDLQKKYQMLEIFIFLTFNGTKISSFLEKNSPGAGMMLYLSNAPLTVDDLHNYIR